MKRKTAKEILAESFKELALTRDVEKITIKEITDNCGYSPATFYRQFKDKYDLMRVLEAYCYGAVKITIDRLLGKYDATPEEMAKIYDLSMPEIFRQGFGLDFK